MWKLSCVNSRHVPLHTSVIDSLNSANYQVHFINSFPSMMRDYATQSELGSTLFVGFKIAFAKYKLIFQNSIWISWELAGDYRVVIHHNKLILHFVNYVNDHGHTPIYLCARQVQVQVHVQLHANVTKIVFPVAKLTKCMVSLRNYTSTIFDNLQIEMFDLVRWISGKEKGTHTVLDAEWILELDVSSFDNTEGL